MNPVTLAELWLPIVLSAIAAFFASFVAWALLPHHKKDWQSTGAAEDDLLRTVKAAALRPGQYVFPHIHDPKDKQACEKMKDSGMGALTVFDGPPNMGRNMALSVVANILICTLVAYVASIALPRGARYLDVFQLVGAAALLGYWTGGIHHGIWFGRPVRNFLTDFADAIAYTLLTAGIFGWLWPDAQGALPVVP
ncbi:MAG TPA: hypothetical protein DEB06_10275 [Phycisphaerales bacterium]|nr:hypothetical protein [Phycisphaerales bacterium]